MKTSKSIFVLDALILVTTLIGFGAMGALALTAIQVAPTISIGQVSSNFSGASGTFSLPISMRNPGPLSISGLSITVTILDQNGTQLSRGGGGPVSLAAGSASQLPVSIPFDLSKTPNATLQELVTTNENLSIRANLAGSIPPLVGLNGTVETTFPWGAPVHNLEFGSASTSSFNATEVAFNVPFNFTNDSQFVNLNGTMSGVVMDKSGNQIGSINNYVISVNKLTFYSGQLSGHVSVSGLLEHSFTLHLTLRTSFGTLVRNVVVSG